MRPSARSLVFLLLAAFLTSSRGQSNTSVVVIGDTSGSMAGFAKASANRLASLYQLIVRNIYGSQLRALSTQVVPVPNNRASYFGAVKSYHGNTDLIRAITEIRKQALDTVLVTDGMQSEGMYLGIKTGLKEMANEGWGIWLFGLGMPFDGRIDSEQVLDLELFRPSIEECAHHQQAESEIRIAKGATRFYDYKGLKTLLIFLFSKDETRGRELVNTLFVNMQADPQFSPKVVEVAPLVSRAVYASEPQLIDLADYVRIDDFSSGIATIRSDLGDAKRTKELRIPIVWRGSSPSLPQALNEVAKYDIGRCSWLDGDPATETVQEGQDASQVTGNARIKFISEMGFFRRTFSWLPFVSEYSEESDVLNLNAWSEFVAHESPWWEALNTDNSWQCPAKVYKLAELIKEVAATAAERRMASNPPKTISFRLKVGPL